MHAHELAPDDLVSLCESLDLGLYAAEILVIQMLQPHKDSFPATIGLLLTPAAEVHPREEAINVPQVLDFSDAVDLLSTADLECVSPGMHRGWEDRRFSCHRSRTTAQDAIGLSLSAEEQQQLVLLAADRRRLFRCPPPVRLVPGDILAAYEHLKRLVARLLEASDSTTVPG